VTGDYIKSPVLEPTLIGMLQ